MNPLVPLALASSWHVIYYTFVFSHQVEYVAGGSAQNTVRLVSRLTNEKQHGGGPRSFVVGKIGRDPLGEILQHLLEQDSVVTRYPLRFNLVLFSVALRYLLTANR